ncbi:MAG: hypothetical protein M0Q91_17210 [Methanoregula sp.]|jgi:hypothetical protein|nr:hypothetical protein [Methanoregula sp.]
MKIPSVILFFVVIFGISAGCMGIAAVPDKTDPIVGSWASENDRMTFFENGKGVSGMGLGGDWEKIGDTHYVFKIYGVDAPAGAYTATVAINYDPLWDTISATEGRQIYHRV